MFRDAMLPLDQHGEGSDGYDRVGGTSPWQAPQVPKSGERGRPPHRQAIKALVRRSGGIQVRASTAFSSPHIGCFSIAVSSWSSGLATCLPP
jgi:hypothetical protein